MYKKFIQLSSYLFFYGFIFIHKNPFSDGSTFQYPNV